MKKLLAALLLCCSATAASAQCSGIFPANTVCGNNTGTPNVPSAVAFSGTISGPGSVTTNGLVTWLNTTTLRDGATAGASIAGAYTWAGNQTYAATGTSNFQGPFQINGNAITWPAQVGTVAFQNGTTNNFSGTTWQRNGFTMTFPGAAANLAALNIADQTLSGGANVTSSNQGTKSSGTFTVDCGASPLQFFTNGGAFTLAPPANDGSCDLLDTNSATPGTITFSASFSDTSGSHGDALTVNNGDKFIIHVERINAISTWTIKAMQ